MQPLFIQLLDGLTFYFSPQIRLFILHFIFNTFDSNLTLLCNTFSTLKYSYTQKKKQIGCCFGTTVTRMTNTKYNTKIQKELHYI